ERLVDRARQQRPALPDGEKRRWWQRLLPRRAPKALPAPMDEVRVEELTIGTEPTYPLAEAERKQGWWQRLRRRLPFGRRG
ncbi:hypothetical protein NL371_26360, partial [Klebsiella pneumoniae]|nr:hypothetical protein [Klebsiella pneumoniae]